MRTPIHPRLWKPDPKIAERRHRHAVVAWERVLRTIERRERLTIVAGLVSGPVLIAALGPPLVLLLSVFVPPKPDAEAPDLRVVVAAVLGLSAIGGGIIAAAGHWDGLTLGDSINQVFDGSANGTAHQPGSPIVILLIIVCTCGTWLVFDALLRLWETWRLRNACRWRVAAALSKLHRSPGVAVADLALPGESAQQPGGLLGVLRYLALRKLATADADGLHAVSLAMRQESWLDPLLGPPIQVEK
jgi:hypothetical protein